MVDPVATRSLTESEIASWNAEGYFMLRELVSQEQAHDMRREIDEILNVVEGRSQQVQWNRQYLRGSAIDNFVNSANMLSIARQLLQAPTLLLTNSYLVKQASDEIVGYHQDEFFMESRNGGFLNIWIALTDAGPEDGGLSIAPGSHKSGRVDCVKHSRAQSAADFPNTVVADSPENCVTPIFKTGDAVAFTNFTVHGSAENRTEKARYSYSTVFARDGTLINLCDGNWQDVLEHPNCNIGPREEIDPSYF